MPECSALSPLAPADGAPVELRVLNDGCPYPFGPVCPGTVRGKVNRHNLFHRLGHRTGRRSLVAGDLRLPDGEDVPAEVPRLAWAGWRRGQDEQRSSRSGALTHSRHCAAGGEILHFTLHMENASSLVNGAPPTTVPNSRCHCSLYSCFCDVPNHTYLLSSPLSAVFLHSGLCAAWISQSHWLAGEPPAAAQRQRWPLDGGEARSPCAFPVGRVIMGPDALPLRFRGAGHTQEREAANDHTYHGGGRPGRRRACWTCCPGKHKRKPPTSAAQPAAAKRAGGPAGGCCADDARTPSRRRAARARCAGARRRLSQPPHAPTI